MDKRKNQRMDIWDSCRIRILWFLCGVLFSERWCGMTREEAIKRLKANREMFVFEETKQALDMAIEALQTYAEKPCKTCGYYNLKCPNDCEYSRQSAEVIMRDATAEEKTSVQRYISSISAEAIQVVQCKDCRWRYVDDCPMYHEEWFTIDEGFGFFDDDYRIIDNTTDNGFCYLGEREEE